MKLKSTEHTFYNLISEMAIYLAEEHEMSLYLREW